MKLINIIVIAFLIGFASCSEEYAIDKLPTGGSTTLDIVIAPPVLMSKADVDFPVYATDDELKINDCILAIFKKEGENNWVKQSIEHYTLAQPASSEGIKSGYIIAEGVTLSFDDVYMLRVIANPMAENVTKYKDCGTLDAFKGIVEGGEAYAFDPTRLVKVGDLEIGSGTGTVLNKNSTTVTVPLTQLAARVDLEVKLDLGDKEWLSSVYEKEDGKPLGGVMSENSLLKQFPNAVSVDGNEIPKLVGKLFYMDRPVVFKNANNSAKGYVVKDYTAVRIDTYRSWTIDISKLVVYNIRTQSIAVLPFSEEKMLTSSYSPNPLKSFFTFYTYGRNHEVLNPLQVHLEGTAFEAEIKEKTKVKSDWYAFVNKNGGQDLSKPTGSNVEVSTGFGGDVHVFFAADKSDDKWEVVENEDVIVENTKKEIGDCSKTFNIEPTAADGATDGILPGNLYDVSITITKIDKNVAPIIKWTVLKWNGVTVDIPDFN